MLTLMSRNLDHRIEVVVPLEDVHVRNELEGWERVTAKKSERKRQAQWLFMRRRERARRLARAH